MKNETQLKISVSKADLKRIAQIQFPPDKFEEEMNEFDHAMAEFVAYPKRSRLEDALLELADMIIVCLADCVDNDPDLDQVNAIQLAMLNISNYLKCPQHYVATAVADSVHIKLHMAETANILLTNLIQD